MSGISVLHSDVVRGLCLLIAVVLGVVVVLEDGDAAMRVVGGLLQRLIAGLVRVGQQGLLHFLLALCLPLLDQVGLSLRNVHIVHCRTCALLELC